MLSNIADILGIVSCIMSFILFLMSRSIFRNISYQQKAYNEERLELQIALEALRQNIWDDNLSSLSIRSKLRTELYKYRQKYWKISSPLCILHICRGLRITQKGITQNNKEQLCDSIDYLIARFHKQEGYYDKKRST